LDAQFLSVPSSIFATFAACRDQRVITADDIVLDPYMGGGPQSSKRLPGATRDRKRSEFAGHLRYAGEDYSARPREANAIRRWAKEIVRFCHTLSAKRAVAHMASGENEEPEPPSCAVHKEDNRERSEHHYDMPTTNSQAFARCVVLRTSQWALDDVVRKRLSKISGTTCVNRGLEMLEQLGAFESKIRLYSDRSSSACVLVHGDAAELISFPSLKRGKKSSLVVTSRIPECTSCITVAGRRPSRKSGPLLDYQR